MAKTHRQEPSTAQHNTAQHTICGRVREWAFQFILTENWRANAGQPNGQLYIDVRLP